MNIPGFTAEASLRREHYHHAQKLELSKESSERAGRVTPARGGRLSRHCYPCMSLPNGEVGHCCIILEGV